MARMTYVEIEIECDNPDTLREALRLVGREPSAPATIEPATADATTVDREVVPPAPKFQTVIQPIKPPLRGPKPKPTQSQPVRNVETGETFDSFVEAAASLGVTPSAIRHAIKHEHKCKGARWEFVKPADPKDKLDAMRKTYAAKVAAEVAAANPIPGEE